MCSVQIVRLRRLAIGIHHSFTHLHHLQAAIDIDAQGQMSDTAAEAKATPEKNVEPKETTESQEPTLEAIDQELLETEDLIAGQQKKVALLQVLRREYLSGQR